MLVVFKELQAQNLFENVVQTGNAFLHDRRARGVSFAQFCFHRHLNLMRGTSADLFQDVQSFGVYPFLYHLSTEKARVLLAFVLSCWRWLDTGRYKNYPQHSDVCGVHNSSLHILFECLTFQDLRMHFLSVAGVSFAFETLLKIEKSISFELGQIANSIFPT